MVLAGMLRRSSVLPMLLCLLAGCRASSEKAAASFPLRDGPRSGLTIIVRDPNTGETGSVNVPYAVAEFLLRRASPDSRITVNGVEIGVSVLQRILTKHEGETSLKYRDACGLEVEVIVNSPQRRKKDHRRESGQ